MGDEQKKSGSSESPRPLSRRDLLGVSTGAVLFGALPALATGCSKPSGSSAAPAASAAAASSFVVRVASVPTAVEGNLLPTLIGDFEKQSKYKVELTAHNDVYALARGGFADVVVSHYGHRDAEAFVLAGAGEWPRTLFSNQMALVGPPSDPAKVRDLQDAGEAFRRIAATKSPFVLNHIEGVQYLTEVLWNAAGRPDRTGWFLDEGRRKEDAIRFAAEKGAYSLWGLTPFLRANHESPFKLEPLVVADPLLQRLLVSIIVKPSQVAAVNAEGATALQMFLLSPATQARIRDVRYPGAEHVQWVPAGRHNRTAMLPKV
jgi:tungstate transport system substrate-binding protein